MFLLLLLAASASASPLVVRYQPGLIRRVLYPYNPFFHYLATSPIVIDIDVDYVCDAEVTRKLQSQALFNVPGSFHQP